MTAAAPPETAAPVVTAIRAAAPKARGLPSRKILLSGALVLGGLVAFAILNGMSDRPRRFEAAAAEAAPQAATPPEALRSAPAHYGASDFDAAPLAPPEDPFWGGHAPPTEDSAAAPAPAASFTSVPISAIDPLADERDAARASPIRFSRAEAPAEQAAPFVHPGRLAPPASRTLIQAGAVIPAALQTAINSDVPGTVTALVTAPVHDSLTGAHVLIPQGARLIGAYQDSATYGERRLRIVWTRLILPSGWSMDLTGLEASDVTGAAGLPARVDNHLGQVAVASLASGALSAAADAAEDDETSVFGQSVGNAAAQEAARVGGRIVDRELAVRPTLRVPAGAPVRVLVSRDLVLRPYRE